MSHLECAYPPATPTECSYLPPDTTGTLASPGMSPGDTQAWIDRHGCHSAATWAIVTPGHADATHVCAAHLAELCDDGDTVRRVVDVAGTVLR